MRRANYDDSPEDDPDSPRPNDISEIPDDLIADPDDRINQSEVLQNIVSTSLLNPSNIDEFNNKRVHTLRLSKLEKMYKEKNKNVVDFLMKRHKIRVDDDYQLSIGEKYTIMRTNKTFLDYHLVVGSCIGLSPIIPNTPSSFDFCFEMDLKKAYRSFKGKHAMVGFDTSGRVLYIGQTSATEVYLAMAPNEFLQSRHQAACRPGHSTGPPNPSQRHYRQLVMMLAHFLEKLPQRAHYNVRSVYEQDLIGASPNWRRVTDCLYVRHYLKNYIPKRVNFRRTQRRTHHPSKPGRVEAIG